jgi:DNA-directed RNA polymerase subunit RPC12/RpoP
MGSGGGRMNPEAAIKKLKEMQESYQDEIGKCSGLLDEQWQEYADVCNLSIQALEKQIAKKPVLIPHWSPSKKDYKCPVCSGDVNRQWEYEHYDDRMIGEEQYEHCPDCGQRIDWSMEE